MVLQVYVYLLDGLLLILLLRFFSSFVRRVTHAAISYVVQTYAVRPQLVMRERSLPGFVRSMTAFQLVCVLAQLFYDTDPSRRRLLVDFVGQGVYTSLTRRACAVQGAFVRRRCGPMAYPAYGDCAHRGRDACRGGSHARESAGHVGRTAACGAGIWR